MICRRRDRTMLMLNQGQEAQRILLAQDETVQC